MALVFDLESNGLLNETTRIHSLVIYDTETEELISCSNPITENTWSIETGVKALQEADEIVGHNIVKFDIPALQKIYPQFKPKGKVFDTLLMSELVYPDIGLIDDKNIKRGLFPKKLRGLYKLEAWGYRVKEYKGDYCKQENCWDNWSPEMQSYCEQDVKVTLKLYKLLMSKKIPEKTIEIEHQFAKIIGLQEQRGVCFDKEKAINLTSILLKDKEIMEEKLQEAFPPEKKIRLVPKKDNKAKGYKKGVPVYEYVPFNPSSRLQIAKRLKEKYGWKPTKLTEKGQAKIDEEVLENLPYSEALLLKDYLIIKKTLGMLSDGDKAWLKMEVKAAIHGGVNTLGAVTGRCTHHKPNLAQTPAISKDKDGNILEGLSGKYGKECRELFKARKGYCFVGCDASGLELRCLAHYMGDEDYTHEILNGDIHKKNQKAAGLPTRGQAKTFIYGFLYGAGDDKVGKLIDKGAKEGKQIKNRFLKALPKLKTLTDGVKNRIKQRGYLKGIDGRILKVREQYKGLNVLLQSAGAIVMKKALCILYDDCVAKGWIEDRYYLGEEPDDKLYFVLNVHDEYQAEVEPEIVDEYKIMAVEAIRKAGEYFKFRCNLDGEAKVGASWFETH